MRAKAQSKTFPPHCDVLTFHGSRWSQSCLVAFRCGIFTSTPIYQLELISEEKSEKGIIMKEIETDFSVQVQDDLSQTN